MHVPSLGVALLAALLLGARLVAAEPAAANSAAETPKIVPVAIENSVVKVFATMRYPDPYRPWTKQAPTEFSGSGVVIEGKRILTNAHVVLYASQVQVQGNQSGDKISASVEFIAPAIDLAVLKLDDASFFDTHAPLARAHTLPDVKDTVLAYGFPAGGTTLSITKGIVSRIDFTYYSYPVAGLRIQIDAAINPGNSGGPAVAGDNMIGLAFRRLDGAQNIGYIIPNEEIELFLRDIADGRYDGKPAMIDSLQTLESPSLRAFVKIDKTVEGIVVHQPDPSIANSPLKEWDIITKIGDTPVDDQGMIKLGTNLRVNFRYLIQQLARDGKVPLTLVRAGKTLPVELPVPAVHPMLIPDLMGEYPPYFVYGPVVFSKATRHFLSFMDNNPNILAAFGFARSPLVTRSGDTPAFAGEELVVISSPFFPHKLAKGYSDPSGCVVHSINGQNVKNLAHLVELLRDATSEFICIEPANRGGETMVFPRQAMVAATEEILTDNDVRAQGSADTLAIWGAKSGK